MRKNEDNRFINSPPSKHSEPKVNIVFCDEFLYKYKLKARFLFDF